MKKIHRLQTSHKNVPLPSHQWNTKLKPQWDSSNIPTRMAKVKKKKW